jgi:hypothetical protein
LDEVKEDMMAKMISVSIDAKDEKTCADGQAARYAEASGIPKEFWIFQKRLKLACHDTCGEKRNDSEHV